MLTASPVTSMSTGTGDDLAGVHADADVELDTVAQLDRRAHCSERVVLVQLRNAEHGHDRIADEFLDRPAVPLDRGPRGVEVASHHGTRRFRVETLGAGGRARHIAEQHGHGLALLTRRLGVAEARSTRVAEARGIAIRGTARGAAAHERTLLARVRRVLLLGRRDSGVAR